MEMSTNMQVIIMYKQVWEMLTNWGSFLWLHQTHSSCPEALTPMWVYWMEAFKEVTKVKSGRKDGALT